MKEKTKNGIKTQKVRETDRQTGVKKNKVKI